MQLLELEKSCKVRLLSLSEVSIQLRTRRLKLVICRMRVRGPSRPFTAAAGSLHFGSSKTEVPAPEESRCP